MLRLSISASKLGQTLGCFWYGGNSTLNSNHSRASVIECQAVVDQREGQERLGDVKRPSWISNRNVHCVRLATEARKLFSTRGRSGCYFNGMVVALLPRDSNRSARKEIA
jgi:hypothetical protein